MNTSLVLFSILLVVLVVVATARHEDPGPVVKRTIEQSAKLLPRMTCALIGAGFIATLIPKEMIAGMLGREAGILAIPIAMATGLIVPAGPVIAFAIAAVFAKAGASTAALITFITSWTIFAGHRILIYELPLLGASFVKMRLLAVAITPLLAGLLTYALGLVSDFGAPVGAVH